MQLSINFDFLTVHDAKLVQLAARAETLLQKDDLLIVEGNGSLDQIGRDALWSDEIAGCSHQNHIIRGHPGPYVLPTYMLYWLLSPVGRTAIETVASSNSGLHTLSISKVSGLPIPICAEDEQQEIASKIDAAFAWIDRLASEASSARKLIEHLDQTVLAKAFRGELVEQDPNDEPASVLLERIRTERAVSASAKGKGGEKRPHDLDASRPRNTHSTNGAQEGKGLPDSV